MNEKQSEKILTALARHMGLIQVADCYAVGENDGGRYVSLFNARLQFRIGTVYQEAFGKLPDFVDTNDCAGDISTERKRVEKIGALRECPAFGFTRYQIGTGDDDKVAWRFGDVLWVKQGAPQPQPDDAVEQAPPQANGNGNGNGNGNSRIPPNLPTRAEAIAWSVKIGAYTNQEQANAYFTTAWHNAGKPATWEDMRPKWLGVVKKRLEEQARTAGLQA